MTDSISGNHWSEKLGKYFVLLLSSFYGSPALWAPPFFWCQLRSLGSWVRVVNVSEQSVHQERDIACWVLSILLQTRIRVGSTQGAHDPNFVTRMVCMDCPHSIKMLCLSEHVRTACKFKGLNQGQEKTIHLWYLLIQQTLLSKATYSKDAHFH